VSRRREYAAAQGTIGTAAALAVMIGSIMLLSLVVEQLPAADVALRSSIGLAGAFLIAVGAWVIRSSSSPPPRFAAPVLGAGLLAGGPVLLGLLDAWLLPLPRGNEFLELLLFGVPIVMMVAGGKVLRATWRLSTDLKDALDAPPTSAELAAESAEDRMSALVEDVRGATMKTDPAHIRFTSSNNLQQRVWEGRLRDEDAVLTWTGTSVARMFRRSGSLILSKDEFRIVSRRAWLRRSSSRAKVFIGDQRFDGWIPNEALERYGRWKANLAVGP